MPGTPPSFDEIGRTGRPSFESIGTTPRRIPGMPQPSGRQSLWQGLSAMTQPVKPIAEGAGAIAKKGLYGGLGAIAWPFERVSGAIGTTASNVYQTAKEQSEIEKEWRKKLIAPAEEAPTFEMVGVGTESLKDTAKTIGKSLISKDMPEESSTVSNVVSDAYSAYYKEVAGEDAPEWLPDVMGGITDFLVTPWATGKVLKGVSALAKASPIGKAIANYRLPEWQRAKLRTRAKTGMRSERATATGLSLSGKKLKGVAKELSARTGKPIHTPAVEQRLGQIIKGGITEQEKLKKIANPVIQEFTNNAKELQKLGILGKEMYTKALPKARIDELLTKKAVLQKQLTRLETAPHYVGTKEISGSFPGRAKKIRDLQGQIDKITSQVQTSYKLGGTEYMPRMYASKEAELLAKRTGMAYSKTRIRAPYAKQRQDLPFELRKEMGEMTRPAYPVMKRQLQQGAEIELGKLFQKAASNPEWTSSSWRPGLKMTAIPEGKQYGALAGKYVHPRIYDDVIELSRIPNKVEQLYDSAIGTWKLGKVVLNPATHFRNKVSNKILLDLSGMGYAEQGKYAFRALKEYRSNSKEYRVAKAYFARTTQVRGEIMDDILRTTAEGKGTGFERALNAGRKGVKKVVAKPAELYQHEEFTNKFMKYLQQRDAGKSVIESVEEANKWLFDYGELASWETKYARRIMPFYTFPRKAIPRVVEAMATRPHTVAKYPLMAKTMTQYSLAKLEMTDKDYEDVAKVLPDYMKEGSYILMPYRDDNGDLRFFDWTYILPWGGIAEAQERGVMESVITNPLIQIVGDVMRNKSSWSDREIWKETDTPEEMGYKKLEYVWRNLMPSLTPKGLYWDKLHDAVTGTPSKYGKKVPLPETIAHTVFGMRTQGIDVKEQKKFRVFDKQRQVEELSGKIKDITLRKSSGNMSQKEYDRLKEQYKNQITEILKK